VPFEKGCGRRTARGAGAQMNTGASSAANIINLPDWEHLNVAMRQAPVYFRRTTYAYLTVPNGT